MSENPSSTNINKKPLTEEAVSNVSAANAVKEGRGRASSTATQPSGSTGVYRPQQGQAHADEAGGEEAPPSYEDAMAADIGPIDGPRDYQPPPASEDGGFANADGKGRGRRDS